MARIDWNYWRLQYVSGADDLTLEALSREPGAPALNTLKKRSSRECWADQRKQFRHQSDTIAHHDAHLQSAAQKIEKIVDTAEMLTRHSKAAKLIGSIAIKAFQSYNPSKLKPSEATQMMKLAIEIERLTEGLATERNVSEVDIIQPIEIKVSAGENSDD